jgi:signal transduction histidine kinase
MRLRSPGGKKDNSATSNLGKGLALTVLTGLGLLLIIGVVFSVAYGSQQITGAAVEQQQTAESLRSATVVRADVAIAVLLGDVEGELEGYNTGEPRTKAMAQAAEALGDLREGVDGLATSDVLEGSPIPDMTDTFVAVASTVLTHLEAGDFENARKVSNSQLDSGYRELATEFIALRTRLESDINAADGLLGRIGNIARFLVAFFIPAAVIIVYREMVVRRQKELELEHRLDAERQLARAREEFVANASHELRTPLTGIAGMAMLLEEELAVAGSAMSRELVDVIIRESSDLERIVEDLLTTARLDAGALHFSFEDVIVALEVEEATASLIRNGADVNVRCSPGIVRADRTRLRQIIRNLLSNAIKYGGPNLRIEGALAGQSYVLLIADDGNGLPEQVEEHLFERFVHRDTDEARTDSVGLGLSIVHALVVGMGGAISYTHEHGESVFTIRLPIAPRRSPLSAPTPATTTALTSPAGADG